MIAHRQVADSDAHRIHDSRCLVSHDRRERNLPFTVDHVAIRAADTRGPHADAHFAGLGLCKLELLDGKPVAVIPAEDSSAHGCGHSHFLPAAANMSGTP